MKIFFIALVIVAFKWAISFYFYPNETLFLKNLIDLEDTYYFPYILNFSELNFNPNYTFYDYEDKILGIPIYSVFFHSIFHLIFNHLSFIILELISLYLFFYIFYRIFKEFRFSENLCIILSLLIFLFPDLVLFFFKSNQFNFVNLDVFKNIYSFRVPRPIITSLYFFSSLLILILIFKNKLKRNNKFQNISIGILLGLCFGSFYVYFVFLTLTIFFIYIFKFFIEKKPFAFLLRDIIYISIVSFLVSLPFLILSLIADPELLERLGLMYLDFSQKKIIINHLISKFFDYKFIILFLLNSLLLFLIFNLKSKYSKKASLLFFLVFLSTILGPLLFLIISPSVIEIYHFINMTIIIGVINILLFSLIIVLIKIKSSTKRFKKTSMNTFLNTGIILLLILINIQQFNNFKKKNHNNTERLDFVNLQKLYETNNSKIDILLTFNIKTQLWWIYKNKKLATVDSSLNSQTHLINELSYIDALKFLNVNKNEFSKMISNKKVNWRYYNENLKYFSWYKYQANSLITYQNKKNFKEDVLKYIQKSSPTKSMQFIIPKDEHSRLINLFESRNYIYPKNIDIIVLKKNFLFKKSPVIDNKIFCKLDNFESFDVYLRREISAC